MSAPQRIDRRFPARRLRVVAWNVNQGTVRKAGRILDLSPDVVVLAECADDPQLAGGALVRAGWTGRNPRKGLGVFVRPGLVASVDEAWDPLREWFLPVRIDAPFRLDVLAVWAMHHRGQEPGPRLGRTHRALEHYAPFLGRGRAIVIGDFNDNRRWDRPGYRSFERTEAILGDAG